jgi:hypothetical protein
MMILEGSFSNKKKITRETVWVPKVQQQQTSRDVMGLETLDDSVPISFDAVDDNVVAKPPFFLQMIGP